MIENKKIGLKIAENTEEAVWEKVRQASETRIKAIEESLIVERELLKLAKKKLK